MIDQSEKVPTLSPPVNQKGFENIRTFKHYLGDNTHTYICAPTQPIAPGAEDSMSA